MQEETLSESGPVGADLHQGFVVAISIRAKEGQGDAVGTILESLVAPTMAEPGVKIFAPYRSPEDDREFFVFELYRDAGGWQTHQETLHFKQAIERLLPLVSRRERLPYIPYIESR